MRSIFVACPMMLFTLVAAAQSIPSVPKLPAGANPPVAAPSATAPSVPSVPGTGISVPGATTSLPGTGTSVPGVGTSVPGASTSLPGASTSVPGAGTSVPGAGQSSNPLEQARIEAECKIPTNATKQECIKLMLNK